DRGRARDRADHRRLPPAQPLRKDRHPPTGGPHRPAADRPRVGRRTAGGYASRHLSPARTQPDRDAVVPGQPSPFVRRGTSSSLATTISHREHGLLERLLGGRKPTGWKPLLG